MLLAAGLALAATLMSGSPAGAAPHHRPAPPVRQAPRTVVLDGARLRQASIDLHHGDKALTATLAQLTAQADQWLGQGPWSVMDKPQTPPGGDKHDYLSQAPYWWPTQPKTADNPWGCPYVQRDGVRNPEVDTITDHDGRGKVFASVYTLTLAWYYTGKAAYAEHAAQILRTWFTDPATRMNPNLDHGQIIPCKYDGRAIGIIDFSQQFTDVLDATAILDTGAPGWTRSDHAGMRAWYSAFETWLGGAFAAEEATPPTTTAPSRHAARRARTRHRRPGPGPADRDRGQGQADRPADRRRRQPAAGTGPHPQLALLDLRPGRPTPGSRPSAGTSAWTCGRTEARGHRPFKAVDYLLPAATGRRAWPTRSWSSTATRRATSCTRPPTRVTRGRGGRAAAGGAARRRPVGAATGRGTARLHRGLTPARRGPP